MVGNSLPMLVYGALCREGVDLSEPEFVIMHVMFLPIMMMQFTLGLLTAQGSLSRLYSAPISTRSLVAWHMFPGGILMSLHVAASLWIQNKLFDSGLPILGPSLFAGVAWASAQLMVSIQHRTLRGPVLTGLPVIVCFIWLQSKYGTWMAQPSHYWSEVTPGDGVMMLIAVAASYWLTVAAVTRDRCGERIQALRIWNILEDAMERWASRTKNNQRPFRSAEQAQLWYEWRYKGIALPVAVATLLVFAALVFVVRLAAIGNVSQLLRELQEGLIGGGGVLSLVAAITGLMVGSVSSGNQIRHHNPTIRDLANISELDHMGHFLATRPISTSTFASCILRNAGKSVLCGWAIWSLVLLLTRFVSGFAANVPAPSIPQAIESWYLPLTLLGAWIAMTTAATIMMTGRSGLFLLSTCGLLIFGFVVDIIVKELASAEAQQLLFQVWPVVFSLLVVTGTAFVIVKARRRQLLGQTGALQTVVAWIILAVIAFMLRPAELPLVAYPLIMAFSALIVLPVATAPLALAWNRNR